MTKRILTMIFSFMLLGGCISTKSNWSDQLKVNQAKINKYYAGINYRIRSKLLTDSGMSFISYDTLYLIERLGIPHPYAVNCYLWNNKRDVAIAYKEIYSREQSRYLLEVRYITYESIGDSLKFLVEQFDTAAIQKNNKLDGSTVFISQVIRGSVYRVYNFDE